MPREEASSRTRSVSCLHRLTARSVLATALGRWQDLGYGRFILRPKGLSQKLPGDRGQAIEFFPPYFVRWKMELLAHFTGLLWRQHAHGAWLPG